MASIDTPTGGIIRERLSSAHLDFHFEGLRSFRVKGCMLKTCEAPGGYVHSLNPKP